jgi:Peptidase family C25/Propeptide_C25/Secretion system C-terminal sorting domain/Peptidase family C25, C terminal ig-like domain/CUB domain
MKSKFINLKTPLFILFVICSLNGFANDKTFELLTEGKKSVQVKFTLGKYVQNEVATEKGNAILFSSEGSSLIQLKGAPALPKFSKSIIIPDKSSMNYKITDSKYIEIEDVLIAPSKGVVSREKNIDEIPYVYGEEYSKDAFYPQNIMELSNPYIVRNYRGQVINVQPFQYNPVTKTLRIYTEITFEIVEDEAVKSEINVFNRSEEKLFNSEFHEIYKSQFLNYSVESKYTAVEETGNMLIIAHSDYISAMDDFVIWKNQRGLKTEIVEYSTVGSSASDIETYVANYYNTNDLIYLLLVGDAEDIPSLNKSGDSDAAYGHISGNDSYAEVFVGRFSAESLADAETQVERTISYERDMQTTATWLSKAVVIASDEGGGSQGDDGESDIQHMDNISIDLLAYNYDLVDKIYDPGASASTVAASVNNGRSLINYVGHGSDYEWVTSGFSVSNVNSLTNENKLPYIFDVACVNGNFHGKTCFAESWMRATNSGNPTGAVAIIASTINQSWDSPMDAQDEMIDILTESYTSNIKRSFGGITNNGIMHMIDEYGSDGSDMANTWTIFGDPSLNVRTDAPTTMTISHNPVAYVGSTDFVVDGDEDVVVCLYFNDEILGTGIIDGGTVTITFDAITSPGTIKLTATAYNKVTYVSDVIVSASDSPYIVKETVNINDAAENNNGEADFGENLLVNLTLNNISDTYEAFGVETKITTIDTNVILVDSVETFGDFTASQVVLVNSAYNIQLKNKFTDQQVLSFDLNITGKDSDDADHDWSTNMNVVVNAPVLKIGDLLIDDSGANNDGVLDPGETATLKLTVSNEGHAAISNVTGVLENITGSSLITVTDNTTDPLSLNSGESKTIEFEIEIDETEAIATVVEIEFKLEDIYDGFYSVSETKEQIIGELPVFLISDGGVNTITTSKALFYDSGNADFNYSNGENHTITFKPRSENEKVVAEFLSFSVEKNGSGCWDYLEVYDGENTAAELIDSYCDANPPTTIIPTNNTGSLTFRFYSDGSEIQEGWKAEITHQESYEVTFVVADNDDNPIEGVTVEFYGRTETTDTNGEVVFAYVSSENDINYKVTKSGYYNSTGTLSVSDEDLTLTVKLNLNTTGVDNITNLETKVYPNPSNGILNLEISGSENQDYKVKIFDILGSVVYNRVYTYGTEIKEQIDISNHPKGMYFISIENEKGVLLNKKIVVK